MSDHVRLEFNVPDSLEGGTYSNVVSVWHTPHEFTLDFATLPPQPLPDEAGALVARCQIVSRIRIPTTVVFDLIRAINENMTAYEQRFGDIARPGEPPGMETPGAGTDPDRD